LWLGLAAGYVLAWAIFGLCAHLSLRASLQALGPTSDASAILGPAALLLAGAYQFTPLKLHFVQIACSPPTLELRSGRPSQWARVLMLGMREGVACIGCCWALMLIMLAGAAGGSGGMLVLAAAMWAEKNAPWGGRLVRPLGLFLAGLGIMLLWGSLTGVLPWLGHDL
jgi:predicted metal-binding membrane protein